MIAACSGGAGDLIYSIPTLRKLGVKTIYVKENFYMPPHGNLHQTMKRMMESQRFECLPTSVAYPVFEFDPGLKFDYNIDEFRYQHNRGRVHIMKNIAKRFGVTVSSDPWLDIPESEIQKPYTVIHLTERWRNHSKVDWAKVLHKIEGKIYFTGFQYEWIDFCSRYGSVTWLPTEDVYDLACVIKSSEGLYCNQSVALTLAQGLGINYWLERKPGKTNTLLYTKIEHLL